jgi:hypothetical protein
MLEVEGPAKSSPPLSMIYHSRPNAASRRLSLNSRRSPKEGFEPARAEALWVPEPLAPAAQGIASPRDRVVSASGALAVATEASRRRNLPIDRGAAAR